MSTSITVATLNLRKSEARWGERAPLLMEQLMVLRPDIIGFQEVDLRLDQGNWLCSRYNDLIWGPGAPEYRIHHMSNPRERVTLEALAVMTHLPVLAHEGLDYLFRNRVAHRIRVDLRGRHLDFYNTHFHHEQDATGNQVRKEQAEKLLAWMGSHGWDVPKVLVGDFNAPPVTKPIRVLEERLRSAYELAHGSEPEATIPTPLIPPSEWPQDWPRGVTVDYIFVSRSLTVMDARLAFDAPHPSDPGLYPSDHYGIAATIEID